MVHPGGGTATAAHLAYIPGGGIYHSAVGDFLAAVSNKYAGVFFAGPGAVRMENLLLRWVADLVGYPAEAAGSIGLGRQHRDAHRDRHRARRAPAPRGGLPAVGRLPHRPGAPLHRKALRIAGLAESPVRRIAMDAGYRMRPDALAEAIAADRAAGLRPWLVIAAAGTTDVGAVDPLEAIADIAAREGCWYHVDAAYGGFFLLTEQGRGLMRGIERSDSVVLDPHKGLFLPYGIGMVIVRNARSLAAAHDYSGHYMQDAARDPGEMSPADLSPELSKHFRALRMWLPLVLLGARPFRAALEEKLLLARYFHAGAEAAGFEVGPPPELSVATYRWVPGGATPEETDRFNQALVDAMRQDGRLFISSTLLGGRFTLRMAALAFRTHRRTIDLALRVLAEQVAALETRGRGRA